MEKLYDLCPQVLKFYIVFKHSYKSTCCRAVKLLCFSCISDLLNELYLGGLHKYLRSVVSILRSLFSLTTRWQMFYKMYLHFKRKSYLSRMLEGNTQL